jgi:Flp pilus assembly pilin Flp
VTVATGISPNGHARGEERDPQIHDMSTSYWSALYRRASSLLAADGQVLLEYALVLALLGIASIAVLQAFGVDLTHLLSRSSSRMATVKNP